MIGAFVCLILANGANLIQPQFTRDRGPGIRGGNMSVVIWMALAMVGFAIVRAVFSFFQGMLDGPHGAGHRL